MRGPETGGIPDVVAAGAGKVAVGSTAGLGTFADSFSLILEAGRLCAETGRTSEGRVGPAVA